MRFGWTQRVRLLGSVHGVVVQAMTLTLGSSSKGKVTMTENRKGQTDVHFVNPGVGAKLGAHISNIQGT